MNPAWWGALGGLGVALLRHAWSPSAPPLARMLASLYGDRDPGGPGTVSGRSTSSWWQPSPADLAVTGHHMSWYVQQLVTTPLALGGVVIGWWITMTLLGSAVPTSLVAMVGCIAVVGGLFIPAALVRSQARRRRLAFGHAVSAFLDLVSVLLAGGAGVETSLMAAADAGDGWAFDVLRNELVRARTHRQSPWDALGDLGRRLAVTDLVDLSATVQLAGTQGARVRSSLTARAGAVRDRHLAQVEADAQVATERMGLPMVFVFIGFIALLGYPALSLIVGGL
jgi:tight adherence protein C